MPKLRVNGNQTHYQVKGDGPDVVLVHGLTASLAFWYATKVFPILGKEFRVTAYDLRGHGYSDQTPTGYTSHALAEDLLGLMDAVGIERARIIGHSYGGSVALHFALLYPERTEGVVICDTGFAALRHLRRIDNWPGWEVWQEQLPQLGITPDWFSQADLKGVDAILEKSLDIPVQFGIRRGGTRDTPRFRKLLYETSVGMDFRDPSGLTEDRLADITPPVLAVYGELSPFRNVAAYLSQTLPNCAGQIVADVGHFFLMHAPDKFIDLVRPFLHDSAAYTKHKSANGASQAMTASQTERSPGESSS